MSKRSMGELICALRKEKGLTQRDLAEKLSVTDKAVSKWERNLSCPDIGSIPTLAEALGVSTDELLQAAKGEHKENQNGKILDIALRGVSLAMGIAAAVASILKEIDLYSGLTMLGLGLACLSLYMFRKADSNSK